MLSNESSSPEDADHSSPHGDGDRLVIKKSDAMVEGALDVVGFRVLVRAVSDLMDSSSRRRADERFSKAFAKVVNVNGAIAKALLDDERP